MTREKIEDKLNNIEKEMDFKKIRIFNNEKSISNLQEEIAKLVGENQTLENEILVLSGSLKSLSDLLWMF